MKGSDQGRTKNGHASSTEDNKMKNKKRSRKDEEEGMDEELRTRDNTTSDKASMTTTTSNEPLSKRRRKTKEEGQKNTTVERNGVGDSDKMSDGEYEEVETRNIVRNGDIKRFKYHKFLPDSIGEGVEEEAELFKKDFYDEFVQFFENEKEALKKLDVKSNWEQFDMLLDKLRRYTDLKFPLEIGEKEQLCKWLFSVITESNADYNVQTRCCNLMRKLIRKKNEKLNLVFPWRPLYEILDKTYFSKFRKTIYTPKDHGNAIVQLVHKLKRYFSSNATDEILAELRPYFCIHDHLLFKAQGFLCTFLPTCIRRTDWYEELLVMWNWVGLYPTWDLLLMSLFAKLAKTCAGLIDWNKHLPFLFSRILKCFDLPIGVSPNSLYDEYPMDECSLFVSFDYAKNVLFIHCAKLIVWMLSPQTQTFDYLRKLLKSIESFYHPSNEGHWTGALGDFMLILCMKFAKRYEQENDQGRKDKESPCHVPESYRLTPKICKEFVELVLPLAMKAMFSKSSQMTSCANHALKELAYLDPVQVFPPLMERCFHGLQTLTETHQTVSALETLALVVFPLLKQKLYPEGQKYLPDLMLYSLPGIDANDFRKTFSTLKFYSALLVCMPLFGERKADQKDSASFHSMLSPRKQSKKLDPFDEYKPASFQFIEDWCIQLLDKFFAVLSNQGPPKKDDTSQDTVSPDLFWGICDLFFNQLSDELHDQCLKKVFNFVSNEFLINARKNVGHMCAAASFANPKTTLGLFIPMCYDKLVSTVHNENGTKSVSLKQDLTTTEIQWYLHILSQVVFRTGRELLKYKKQLSKLIELTWNHDEKDIVKSVGKLFKNLLKSLTFYYVKDIRNANPSLWTNDEFINKHWKYWAEYPYLEDLELKWHIPSKEEVDFALELVNSFLPLPCETIRQYIDFLKTNEGANYMDINEHPTPATPSNGQSHKISAIISAKHVKHSLLLIRYILRGGSILFPEISSEQTPENNRYPGSPKIKSGIGLVEESQLKVNYSHIAFLLHDLAQSLLKYRTDSTKLMSVLIKVLYPLHCMRGGITMSRYKKKKESHQSVKQHNFKVYNINSDEKKGKNKYPRYLLVIRALLTLKQRFVLHNESIPFTKAHEASLQDLLDLSLSSYAVVRKKAQNVFITLIRKFSPKVLKKMLPNVINVLSNKDKEITDEKQTGAIYILERDTCTSQIIMDWDLLSNFMITMCQTDHIEKQSIQNRIMELYELYFNAFYQTSLDSKNMHKYYELFHLLLSQAEKVKHWKFQTMITAFLMLLIRSDHSVLFPVDAIKWLFKNLISDIERVRQISVDCLNLLLEQYKPIHPRKYVSLNPQENMIQKWENIKYPETEKEWNDAEFFEKNYFGWYLNIPKSKVYIYNDDLKDQNVLNDFIAPEKRQELVRELESLFTPEYLSKLFELLVIREDIFNETNAQFFKGLFQLLGFKLLDNLKPHFQHILSFMGCQKQEEIHYMSTAAEFLSGLFRGMKHWSYKEMKQVHEYLFQQFDKVLQSCSLKAVPEFSEALEFCVCDKDPRRIQYLRDYLLQKFEQNMGTGSSSNQLRFIKYLYCVAGEISWRDPKTLDTILAILSKHMCHPYQQVREYISLFVALILRTQWVPKRDEKTNIPTLVSDSAGSNTSGMRDGIVKFFENLKQEFQNMKDKLEEKQSSFSPMKDGNAMDVSEPLSAASTSSNHSSNDVFKSPHHKKTPPSKYKPHLSISTTQSVSTKMMMMMKKTPGSPSSSPMTPTANTETGLVPPPSPSPSTPTTPTTPDSARSISAIDNIIPSAKKSLSDQQADKFENSVFKCLSKTTLTFIASLYSSNCPHAALSWNTDLLDMLATIQDLSDEEELQIHSKSASLIMANFFYTQEESKKILDFLNDRISTYSNWKVRAALLEFLQIFGYRQQFYLLDQQNTLFDLIVTMLKDPQLEVREVACTTLAGFMKISDMSIIEKFSDKFKKWAADDKMIARKKKSKHQKRKQNRSLEETSISSRGATIHSANETLLRHCGILGLSAIIKAFPYEIPDFLPPLLVLLANYSNDHIQPIRETVKKTFTQFWKLHGDVWFLQKKKFTEDQLLTLNELLISPSYYA